MFGLHIIVLNQRGNSAKIKPFVTVIDEAGGSQLTALKHAHSSKEVALFRQNHFHFPFREVVKTEELFSTRGICCLIETEPRTQGALSLLTPRLKTPAGSGPTGKHFAFSRFSQTPSPFCE